MSNSNLEQEMLRLIKQIQDAGVKNAELNQQFDILREQNNELKSQLQKGAYSELSREENEIIASKLYAGVINIPNLRSLANGWEIDIKNWEEYQSFTQNKGTLVAVVGNYCKGKTFLLELLSGHKTPHGFNVNTRGISIVYLKDPTGTELLPIIGLDTKGGSLPLDLSALSLNKLNGTPDPKLEEETLKDILRDHEATEDIVQNFIMEKANIIIVVVSDLTFNDQKLIKKIKKKFKNEGSKKIIIVHNLYHAYYEVDVNYKISEFIQKAFTLEEHTFKKLDPNKNKRYFVETTKTSRIPHIILAKQNSPAGNYYNDVGIGYIKESIYTNDSYKSIDVVQEFQKYLQTWLSTYMRTEPELKQEDIKLVKATLEKPTIICLEKKEKVQMKAVFADEFGYRHMYTDGFQPSYAIYEEKVSEEEKYFCLKVECPGIPPTLRTKIQQTTTQFRIDIQGTKEPDMLLKDDLAIDTRHFGKFLIMTDVFEKSKYNFDYSQKPEGKYIDGTFLCRWKLLPVNDDDDEGWNDA